MSHARRTGNQRIAKAPTGFRPEPPTLRHHFWSNSSGAAGVALLAVDAALDAIHRPGDSGLVGIG